MMREIKFRAYIYDLTNEDSHPLEIDVRAGKLWDVASINFKDRTVEIMDDDGNVWEYELNSNEIVLLQYAGLKDKNGKKIYEGYIIKKSSGAIGEVVYLKATAGYKLYNNGQVFDLFEADARYLEIIGNVYENPELLQ